MRLVGGDGADLRQVRPVREVLVRLLIAAPERAALDTHLPVQAVPVEQQCHVIVGGL